MLSTDYMSCYWCKLAESTIIMNITCHYRASLLHVKSWIFKNFAPGARGTRISSILSSNKWLNPWYPESIVSSCSNHQNSFRDNNYWSVMLKNAIPDHLRCSTHHNHGRVWTRPDLTVSIPTNVLDKNLQSEFSCIPMNPYSSVRVWVCCV